MIRVTNSKLKINLRALSNWMTSIIVAFPVLYALTDMLRISGIVKLMVDGLWLCVAVLPLFRKKLQMKRALIPFMLVVAVFVLDTFLVYLARYQSVFYYIWGLRNYLRFYVVFFAVAENFEYNTAEKCLSFLEKFFWINLVLVLIQFMMGFEQDNIGGIFGVTKGCNGYLVLYMSVLICRSILLYMQGAESTLKCFMKCAAALVVSALSELKFFFFLFIMLLMLAMVLTSFSFKKVILFLVSAAFLSVAATVLGSLYSYFDGFFSIESVIDTLTRDNYASSGDMGRFSAIGDISEKFLTTLPDQLFGMGLGNCDVSTISIFNTKFYDLYVDLHYSIFSYSFMFLENGYIGLFLYVLFFVFSLIASFHRLKSRTGNKLFCQMGVMMSFACLVLIFYNSSLRTEGGFMVYFVLALPFIDKVREETDPQPGLAADAAVMRTN